MSGPVKLVSDEEFAKYGVMCVCSRENLYSNTLLGWRLLAMLPDSRIIDCRADIPAVYQGMKDPYGHDGSYSPNQQGIFYPHSYTVLTPGHMPLVSTETVYLMGKLPETELERATLEIQKLSEEKKTIEKQAEEAIKAAAHDREAMVKAQEAEGQAHKWKDEAKRITAEAQTQLKAKSEALAKLREALGALKFVEIVGDDTR